jgi:hypothetical protein
LRFAGTSTDPVWVIESERLGDRLRLRPDPRNAAAHLLVEPSRAMTLEEYRGAVVQTALDWREYNE